MWRAYILVGVILAGCTKPASDPWIPTAPQVLLWDMFSPQIVVEVDQVEGREIPSEVLEAAVDELRSLTGRAIAVGTLRTLPRISPDADRERSQEEAVAIAEEALDHPSDTFMGSNGSAVLHVVALDGRVGTLRHPLGFNHYNIAFVFPDQIARMQPTGTAHPNFGLDLQRTLTHEMGHAVGLVNCHVPMVRTHDDGGCHSIDQDSVMSVRSSSLGSTFELVQPGSLSVHFDDDDRDDIAAYVAQGRRCAVDPIGCNEPWRGSKRG